MNVYVEGVIKVKDRLWFHTLIPADTSQQLRLSAECCACLIFVDLFIP